MDQNTLQVEDNMVVRLSYSLTASGAQDEKETEMQSIKQIVQGRKQIVPGLEQALYGMQVGDEKNVTVEPSQGFGDINPAAIQTLPRNSVPSFATAIQGQRLRLLDKKNGKLRRATVVDVKPDTIVLDFNHPFAGKTLHYHLHIDNIRQATPKELDTGQIVAS